MPSLDPNAVFAGRYRIVRCIATGGMGAVYEVIHLETERRRALKVMHAHFVQSPELRDRFKREAKVAAQIDSEFIVDVFDAGVDEATQMPFLVMELLRGEELGKRLARSGRLAPHEAITYLWQTALALDKTHKASIVHRDLKPDNLFLVEREDGQPRVKVLDFGVAKFVAETGTQGATRSLGTPLYMSPEQFRGLAVSPASDIFALSLLAYTLLVGEPYWAPEATGDVDLIAFALKTVAGPTESPALRAARKGVTLPPGFDAWFRWATIADPTRRPPSATACIAALGEAFGLPPSRLLGIGPPAPLQAGTAAPPVGGPPAPLQASTVGARVGPLQASTVGPPLGGPPAPLQASTVGARVGPLQASTVGPAVGGVPAPLQASTVGARVGPLQTSTVGLPVGGGTVALQASTVGPAVGGMVALQASTVGPAVALQSAPSSPLLGPAPQTAPAVTFPGQPAPKPSGGRAAIAVAVALTVAGVAAAAIYVTRATPAPAPPSPAAAPPSAPTPPATASASASAAAPVTTGAPDPTARPAPSASESAPPPAASPGSAHRPAPARSAGARPGDKPKASAYSQD